MQGEIDSARELHTAARQTYLDAGMTVTAASVAMHRAWIEERAGDLDAWEAALREGKVVLEGLGERAFYGTVTASLAQCLHIRGQFDEIPGLCEIVRTTSTTDDVVNYIYLDGLESALHAREGRPGEAERAGRRALELAETTDYFFMRTWVRILLAETLARSGRAGEATAVASEALAILDAKGDRTGALRWREYLDRHRVTYEP